MLAKLSVDQALMKAKSHAKKGEVAEAKKLYEGVLHNYSQNKRAQQGLADLNKIRPLNTIQNPPQEVIDQLVNIYNQGQLSLVVEQAQALTKQYPETFIFWNILGASAAQIGMADQAIVALKKVISMKPDYIEAYSNISVALLEKGKLDEALEACKKAVLLNPNYANAYYNMGKIFHEQGKLDEAIEVYKKSITLNSNYADAYANMGVALKEKGMLDEAVEAYNKVVLLKPDSYVAFNNIGNILKSLGKLDNAIQVYKKALLINPQYAEAHSNMGNTLHEQGKLDEAIEAHKKSILLNPNYAEAYYNMGNVLEDQKKLDDAIEAYKKALQINPNFIDVYSNLGIILQEQEKFDEAIEVYNQCLLLKHDYAEVYSNLGHALFEKGNFDEAIIAQNKSISLKPNYAQAYNNKGLTLQRQGKLDQAIFNLKRAIAIKKDHSEAHLNLSMSLLQFNLIKEGLEEYEWRWKIKEVLSSYRNFPKSQWDGQASLKDKTILLWCEQGIGDTMNWSSCLSLLTARAKHVILECQEKLVPLLSRSFPNIEVKAQDRSIDADRDDFDFHLPMGSLYKHFINEIMEKGKSDSYLVPDPVRVQYWKDRLQSVGKGPYIGLSWKSSNMSPGRLPNYPSILEWSPIFNIPDVTFINLQYTNYEDDIVKVEDEFGVKIHNFDDIDHFNDIDEVAALCAALDIIITNKTTVSFISAGVGTSTKIANWKQSPWNNVLLDPAGLLVEKFERNTWENWQNVINVIAKDIKTSNILG